MTNKTIELFQTPTGEPLQYFHTAKDEFLQAPDGIKYPINGNIVRFLHDNSLTGNNAKYQKMYDRFSGFYDCATKIYALLNGENERKRVMQYLSFLRVKEQDKFIEISIGTGRNIRYLPSNAEYYGVDISMGMLQKCRRKMKRFKRDIVLIQAEAEFLPLKDSTFDVIFSAGGFNFYNDPAKAVTEMLRIAKPGAKLLIYDETEKLRLKHSKNNFYKDIEIKNPTEYLPYSCKNIEYKEVCDGDLYVLTFQKP